MASDAAALPLLALLQRTVRDMQDDLVAGLEAAGVEPITPAHTTVLAHLDDDAALSIAELARRAGVTRQTMHRAVAQLVDEGLLTSRPGAGFPRSTLIEYSDVGRQRRAVAMGVLRRLERELGERWGAGDVAHLREVLTRG
jgi:DNA-binding MarR family transcriptional regulator